MLTYILYLFLGLLAIGFVVFLHELGHFAAARMLGVEVEVLSYGMGPKVFSIYGRKTEYRLSLFLFGGYCRMKGSLDLMKALKDDSKYINRAEEGSSAASLIPVERLSDEAIVTPVTEYSALFSNPVSQESIHKGDKLISSSGHIFLDWQDAEAFIKKHSGSVIPVTVLRDGEMVDTAIVPHKTADGWSYGLALLQKAVVGSSLSDSFQPGDRIIAIDDTPVEYTLDVYSYPKDSFTVTIERDGDTLTREIENGELPFSWKSDIRKSRDSVSPILYGIKRASDMFVSAMKTLGAFITFHLEDALTVMTGPVKAAESIGHITAVAFDTSASSGLRSLLMLASFISVSLSVGNALPIPTFDGGQMLINIIEMIYRRELSPRTYVLLQITGMILALIIMIMMYSLDVKAYFFS